MRSIARTIIGGLLSIATLINPSSGFLSHPTLPASRPTATSAAASSVTDTKPINNGAFHDVLRLPAVIPSRTISRWYNHRRKISIADTTSRWERRRDIFRSAGRLATMRRRCRDDDANSRGGSGTGGLATTAVGGTAGVAYSYSVALINKGSLLLLSMILVNTFRRVFFPAPSDAVESAGIMDRCPWPFIFFHDVKTGLKDSPTWIMIVWFVLCRVWKVLGKTATGAVVVAV
mmetsp:Transcript_6997/g.8717  ORF Transcript_6997/g.8717 Transcript_6997/m.8717 type:complete len:232 (-) Transcript_6997:199-894(-)|eukprot:CAMPEP_0172505750 /NCGR_PEP_ID=MMETSP1066-20121228/188738_1 /TAXON_ID=671091 /ORGANISM="Coscinodiscus wailesii, Strain CCMP2513" /LENGTH=231 /DNA_ID=CAMNT_0013282483 /DNA_START=254 /DNA_END=949 /DNA_ORIENTATION=-